MNVNPIARKIPIPPPCDVTYSICTLVTNPKEYGGMLDSFINAGFTARDCEFLYIDNTAGNTIEAFAGCNLFLDSARGRYVILCHQDILLQFDDRKTLDRRILELDGIDPDWALAGNAGGVAPDANAVHISHPAGEENTWLFPVRAQCLDENFIMVKKEANLCLSHDLKGFHLYGTDLCQTARMLGWNAWVVDFHLLHKSEGCFGESFFEMSREFAKKYQRAMKGLTVQTMGIKLHLSGSPVTNWLKTPSRRRLIFNLLYENLRRRKKGLPPLKPPIFLAKPLGFGWIALYWLAHRICVPFENLARSAAKRYSRWKTRSKLQSITKNP